MGNQDKCQDEQCPACRLCRVIEEILADTGDDTTTINIVLYAMSEVIGIEHLVVDDISEADHSVH